MTLFLSVWRFYSFAQSEVSGVGSAGAGGSAEGAGGGGGGAGGPGGAGGSELECGGAQQTLQPPEQPEPAAAAPGGSQVE